MFPVKTEDIKEDIDPLEDIETHDDFAVFIKQEYQHKMETQSSTRQASEIQQLYEPPDDFDDQGSDSDSEDILEEHRNISNEEESEEEQIEIIDENESSENEDEPPKRKRGRSSYLRGKDNIKWSLTIPKNPDKINKPAYTSTPIKKAAIVKNPLEAWSVFFDENILKIILLHTNEEINRQILKKNKNQLKSYHKEVELIELKAILGLLYFSGLQKVNHTNVESLWSPYGMSLFKITMPAQRFQFLIACMTFDNKKTRRERKTVDPFTNIREIWDKFMHNCKINYQPDSKCAINEQLLPFRGKCRFRMHFPNKPKNYNLKVVTLNDSVTQYLINAIPYYGSTITDKDSTETVPSYYIRKLAEPIYDTNRNITCDEWYTSVPICDRFLNEYNLTMVGLIHKKNREIPFSFKTKEDKIRFAFNDKKILVSFNPKGKKNVLLLSTYHDTAKIDTKTGIPEIFMFYNETKGGYKESFDKKCQDFTTARKTLRWPMRYFYGMLDQANVNSFIIYNLNSSNKKMVRNDYILDLSFSLIKPFLVVRLTWPSIQTVLRSQIEGFLGYKDLAAGKSEYPKDLKGDNKLVKYKRCGFCPTSLDRKTCYKCLKCNLAMCKDHTAKICVDCSIHELSS